MTLAVAFPTGVPGVRLLSAAGVRLRQRAVPGGEAAPVVRHAGLWSGPVTDRQPRLSPPQRGQRRLRPARR